jgi:hypothetical protein
MIQIELSLLIRGDHPSVRKLSSLKIGRAWRSGDATPSAPGNRHAIGGWELRSDRAMTDSLRDHVQFVLDATTSHWPALLAAAESSQVVLSVAMYITPGPNLVGTTLDQSQLARLAALGASLDIDLYDFAPVRD